MARFFLLQLSGYEGLYVVVDPGSEPVWEQAQRTLQARGIDFEVREVSEYPRNKCLTPDEALTASE